MDKKKKTHQWIVPEDHPFFKGHFPGDPVLPSIALIEQCFELIKNGSEQELHLVQIHKAKFKEVVRPGDILQFHFEESALNIWPVKVKNQLLKEVAQLKLELGQSQLT